jgi:hypothetical protein
MTWVCGSGIGRPFSRIPAMYTSIASRSNCLV